MQSSQKHRRLYATLLREYEDTRVQLAEARLHIDRLRFGRNVDVHRQYIIRHRADRARGMQDQSAHRSSSSLVNSLSRDLHDKVAKLDKSTQYSVQSSLCSIANAGLVADSEVHPRSDRYSFSLKLERDGDQPFPTSGTSYRHHHHHHHPASGTFTQPTGTSKIDQDSHCSKSYVMVAGESSSSISSSQNKKNLCLGSDTNYCAITNDSNNVIKDSTSLGGDVQSATAEQLSDDVQSDNTPINSPKCQELNNESKYLSFTTTSQTVPQPTRLENGHLWLNEELTSSSEDDSPNKIYKLRQQILRLMEHVLNNDRSIEYLHDELLNIQQEHYQLAHCVNEMMKGQDSSNSNAALHNEVRKMTENVSALSNSLSRLTEKSREEDVAVNSFQADLDDNKCSNTNTLSKGPKQSNASIEEPSDVINTNSKCTVLKTCDDVQVAGPSSIEHNSVPTFSEVSLPYNQAMNTSTMVRGQNQSKIPLPVSTFQSQKKHQQEVASSPLLNASKNTSPTVYSDNLETLEHLYRSITDQSTPDRSGLGYNGSVPSQWVVIGGSNNNQSANELINQSVHSSQHASDNNDFPIASIDAHSAETVSSKCLDHRYEYSSENYSSEGNEKLDSEQEGHFKLANTIHPKNVSLSRSVQQEPSSYSTDHCKVTTTSSISISDRQTDSVTVSQSKHASSKLALDRHTGSVSTSGQHTGLSGRHTGSSASTSGKHIGLVPTSSRVNRQTGSISTSGRHIDSVSTPGKHIGSESTSDRHIGSDSTLSRPAACLVPTSDKQTGSISTSCRHTTGSFSTSSRGSVSSGRQTSGRYTGSVSSGRQTSGRYTGSVSSGRQIGSVSTSGKQIGSVSTSGRRTSIITVSESTSEPSLGRCSSVVIPQRQNSSNRQAAAVLTSGRQAASISSSGGKTGSLLASQATSVSGKTSFMPNQCSVEQSLTSQGPRHSKSGGEPKPTPLPDKLYDESQLASESNDCSQISLMPNEFQIHDRSKMLNEPEMPNGSQIHNECEMPNNLKMHDGSQMHIKRPMHNGSQTSQMPFDSPMNNGQPDDESLLHQMSHTLPNEPMMHDGSQMPPVQHLMHNGLRMPNDSQMYSRTQKPNIINEPLMCSRSENPGECLLHYVSQIPNESHQMQTGSQMQDGSQMRIACNESQMPNKTQTHNGSQMSQVPIESLVHDESQMPNCQISHGSYMCNGSQMVNEPLIHNGPQRPNNNESLIPNGSQMANEPQSQKPNSNESLMPIGSQMANEPLIHNGSQMPNNNGSLRLMPNGSQMANEPLIHNGPQRPNNNGSLMPNGSQMANEPWSQRPNNGSLMSNGSQMANEPLIHNGSQRPNNNGSLMPNGSQMANESQSQRPNNNRFLMPIGSQMANEPLVYNRPNNNGSLMSNGTQMANEPQSQRLNNGSLMSNGSQMANEPLIHNGPQGPNNNRSLMPNGSQMVNEPLIHIGPNNNGSLMPNGSQMANEPLSQRPNNNKSLMPNGSQMANVPLIHNGSQRPNNNGSLMPNRSQMANESLIHNGSQMPNNNKSLMPNGSQMANEPQILNGSQISSINGFPMPNGSQMANKPLIHNGPQNGSLMPNGSQMANEPPIRNGPQRPNKNGSLMPNGSKTANDHEPLMDIGPWTTSGQAPNNSQTYDGSQMSNEPLLPHLVTCRMSHTPNEPLIHGGSHQMPIEQLMCSDSQMPNETLVHNGSRISQLHNGSQITNGLKISNEPQMHNVSDELLMPHRSQMPQIPLIICNRSQIPNKVDWVANEPVMYNGSSTSQLPNDFQMPNESYMPNKGRSHMHNESARMPNETVVCNGPQISQLPCEPQRSQIANEPPLIIHDASQMRNETQMPNRSQVAMMNNRSEMSHDFQTPNEPYMPNKHLMQNGSQVSKMPNETQTCHNVSQIPNESQINNGSSYMSQLPHEALMHNGSQMLNGSQMSNEPLMRYVSQMPNKPQMHSASEMPNEHSTMHNELKKSQMLNGSQMPNEPLMCNNSQMPNEPLMHSGSQMYHDSQIRDRSKMPSKYQMHQEFHECNASQSQQDDEHNRSQRLHNMPNESLMYNGALMLNESQVSKQQVGVPSAPIYLPAPYQGSIFTAATGPVNSMHYKDGLASCSFTISSPDGYSFTAGGNQSLPSAIQYGMNPSDSTATYVVPAYGQTLMSTNVSSPITCLAHPHQTSQPVSHKGAYYEQAKHDTNCLPQDPLHSSHQPDIPSFGFSKATLVENSPGEKASYPIVTRIPTCQYSTSPIHGTLNLPPVETYPSDEITNYSMGMHHRMPPLLSANSLKPTTRSKLDSTTRPRDNIVSKASPDFPLICQESCYDDSADDLQCYSSNSPTAKKQKGCSLQSTRAASHVQHCFTPDIRQGVEVDKQMWQSPECLTENINHGLSANGVINSSMEVSPVHMNHSKYSHRSRSLSYSSGSCLSEDCHPVPWHKHHNGSMQDHSGSPCDHRGSTSQNRRGDHRKSLQDNRGTYQWSPWDHRGSTQGHRLSTQVHRGTTRSCRRSLQDHRGFIPNHKGFTKGHRGSTWDHMGSTASASASVHKQKQRFKKSTTKALHKQLYTRSAHHSSRSSCSTLAQFNCSSINIETLPVPTEKLCLCLDRQFVTGKSFNCGCQLPTKGKCSMCFDKQHLTPSSTQLNHCPVHEDDARYCNDRPLDNDIPIAHMEEQDDKRQAYSGKILALATRLKRRSERMTEMLTEETCVLKYL